MYAAQREEGRPGKLFNHRNWFTDSAYTSPLEWRGERRENGGRVCRYLNSEQTAVWEEKQTHHVGTLTRQTDSNVPKSFSE